MNKKHLIWIIPLYLIWIIPLCLVIGLIIGNEIFVCHRETAPHNPNVQNIWDCEEGCLYAKWIIYGYKNLTEQSELYTKCNQVCYQGDDYFSR